MSPPWAGKSNGFTLLFEALLMQLCTQMPVQAVARIASVSDDKLWRMLEKYVDLTRELEDFSEIDSIGVDETSQAKNHNYITLFVDLKKRRTIFITEGKSAKTIKDFSKDLVAHKGTVEAIKDVSSDMSRAFISGVKEYLPNAKITFDKFHIIKLINDAVDDVRISEVGDNPILKGSKYVLLKSPSNRTTKQNNHLRELSKQKYRLKSHRAMEIKEAFRDLYSIEGGAEFKQGLEQWHSWARRCRIDPMKKVAATIKRHWDGVLQWRKTGLSNGILEGLNSLVQAAKAKARGYRTFRNFRIITYLVTGKLDFSQINVHLKSKPT